MTPMVSLSRFRVLLTAIVLGTANCLPALAESEFAEIDKSRSEISILGDDGFILKRMAKNGPYQYREAVHLDGGVIMYSRTHPGAHFTYANDPRTDIRDRLNDSPKAKAFGLSVEIKEVKRGETVDFYYLCAAKGNFKGSCFHASGFFGVGDFAGSQVMDVSVCRPSKWGGPGKLRDEMQDIIKRLKFDGGKLNRKEKGS